MMLMFDQQSCVGGVGQARENGTYQPACELVAARRKLGRVPALAALVRLTKHLLKTVSVVCNCRFFPHVLLSGPTIPASTIQRSRGFDFPHAVQLFGCNFGWLDEAE